MDLATPLLNAAILAVFTVILAWLAKARFDSLERRMDAHEERNERRFEQLAAEIAQLRSDLLQVVLAQGSRPRPQTG